MGQRASFRVVNETERKKAWGAQGTKLNYQNLVSIFVTENEKLATALSTVTQIAFKLNLSLKAIHQVSACRSLMK